MSAGRLQGLAAGTGGDSVRPAGGMGADTKPTLPVTPPAGFKLMQDPFTGQLFIIPGQFTHLLCKKNHALCGEILSWASEMGSFQLTPILSP